MGDQGLSPFATNVTSKLHRTSYPSIDASRPELSQAGKAVLITGGTTGIGFAITKAFITASASTVIITGRRQEVLDKAVSSLKDIAATLNKDAQIIGERGDVAKPDDTNALWASLAERGIIVDVLVLNAARFAVPKPLFELGVDFVWESFEVNVRGPLHFAERFYKQAGSENRPKSLVNISTQSIHESKREYVPMAADRPEYGLTKASGTLAIQYVAQEVPADKMQVVSFHPGMVFTEPWVVLGATPDLFTFDDPALAGNYAVWAASTEARFLHGRFTWAAWDVDEVRERYERRLETDPDFLRVGVCGLKGPDVAY
ncbi:hypothetical protein B0T16DRAFT_315651 [Cercophora newfieldiana]|uniref:Uncharacterized protein n=1 Tax=Cercophora newfieldiana TaxID=92897 RepID=A0AA39YT00_9PEZI|nr:hypothetical protein B0T16DRAFT_315651 [Cercophora newfieldiana]